jgi:hypothetical protein
MSAQIPLENVRKPLLEVLDETFSKVHGIYLDKGTTLYDTLDGVSAAEASSAASTNSATIAAQVEHLRFYLDVLNDFMKTNEIKKTNWREIWDTVHTVTPDEWEKMKKRLRESHANVLNTIKAFDKWDGEYDFAGAMSIVVHTAYHLGGIRQALGVIRANRSQN